MTYAMTCSCGDAMKVEAGTRVEAVTKMKRMMTEEAVTEHILRKHPGEKVPTLAEVHRMIEQGLKAAA